MSMMNAKIEKIWPVRRLMDMTTERLRVREARLEDWDEIKRLCKDIWEGEDYVPDVFPHWLEANDCHPFVLEDSEERRLLGVVNIRRMNQDETAWFEGIRIDPAYQGRGLGNFLTNFIVSWSREHLPSARRYRLMIAEDNRPSLRLAKKHGFDIIATSVYCRLNCDENESSWHVLEHHVQDLFSEETNVSLKAVAKTGAADADIRKFYLETWRKRVKVNALLVGWSFTTVSPENIAGLLEDWSFFSIAHQNGELIGMCGWKIEDDNNGSQFIRLLVHGNDEHLPLILKQVITHLRQRFPEILVFRCHAQAEGSSLESMFKNNSKSIDFYRFFLLEKNP